MTDNDKPIEQVIQEQNLEAPRIKPEDIKANIFSVRYINAAAAVAATGGEALHVDGQALSMLTICVIVLNNGFTVTGESACASPERYNQQIGERLARESAERKIWPLMGYALKEQLSKGTV
jgi:hypothetical protein